VWTGRAGVPFIRDR